MKRNIYVKVMLLLTVLITVFHLCITAKLIPYATVWGGRLKNDRDMYTFEIVSILVNLVLILVLLAKGRYLNFTINGRIISIVLWIFFVIFILNTIGNLFATTVFEKSFSLLTAVSSVLIWKIINIKQQQNGKSI
jgi:hypothetical protein